MRHHLTADDFPAFFQALNGFEPFPWQSKLAERVLSEKAWPLTIDLPTSFGKTSCLQVALFALAALGNESPRRIFFVVDRRIIVDAAYQKAQEWAFLLKTAAEGTVLAKARENLEHLAGSGILKEVSPLKVYQLRGGVYRDSSWIENPLAPSIICTTVDQIGSRLFFRGYGVSEKTLPRHAALVGNDSLIILDEAHCSRPFEQTMRRFERLRNHEGTTETSVKNAPQFVVMSATPAEFDDFSQSEARQTKFTFSEHDRVHRLLAQRLGSVKETELVVFRGVKGVKFEKKLAAELLKLAHGALEEHGVKRLAVMVNNVSTARETARQLDEKLAKRADIVLMTGRMRELDRRELLNSWEPLLRSNPEREPDRPVVVVATQCLEVGADFDFDSMITECASLSAIEQRFGRLDRLGARGRVRAWIGVREDQQDIGGKEDPIYGNAMPCTWRWLNDRAQETEHGRFIDLGISHLRRLKSETSAEEMKDVNTSADNAPILLPPYLDCWVQTSPRPLPEAEIAPFLRGEERASNDVRVIWRDQVAGRSGNGQESLLEELVLRPPSVSESLAVPIALFRSWVTAGEKAEGKGEDIEGFGTKDEEIVDKRTRIEPKLRSRILRYLGTSDTKTRFLEWTNDIAPNDLFIIDAGAEGSELLGDFYPTLSAREGVSIRWDRGDEAQLLSRQKAVLSLSRETLADFKRLAREKKAENDLRVWEQVEALLFPVDDDGVFDPYSLDPDELLTCLHGLENSSQPPSGELYRDHRDIAWHIAKNKKTASLGPFETRDGYRYILTTSKKFPVGQAQRLTEDDAEPVDDTLRSLETADNQRIRITLQAHCARVGALASDLANRLGLSPELVSDLKLAGQLHDLGKADLRFQAWLCDGSRALAHSLPEAIAKSGKRHSLAEMKRCRADAGYPKGKRHEFLSAAVLHEQPHLLAEAHDPDLVHYLVAVHHGFARPFPLEVEDKESCELKSPELFALSRAGDIRSDFGDPVKGHAERFWRLVKQYGWWQLALLETILTSADGLSSGSHEIETTDAPELPFQGQHLPPSELRPKTTPYTLELPGLQGTNLLAFLATLGAFRQISRERPNENFRLSWSPTATWTPVIHGSSPLDPEGFLDCLESALRERESEYFLTGSRIADIKGNVVDLDPNKYAEKDFLRRAQELLQKALDGDRTQLDWLCAFAAPVRRYVAGKPEENLGSTAFRTLGAGRTSLIAAIKELRKVTERKHLREALFAPWSYGDLKNNLRLDPIDDRRYALMGSTPTNDSAEPTKTMRGANRLALEAFPLFPVWPGIRKVETAGFLTRGSNNTYFHWPVWTNPMELAAIRSLLWVRDWHEDKYEAARKGLTIAAVYRSQRFNFGKYRNFAPAQELPQKPEELALEVAGKKVSLLKR
jgi:CRISPR-associated endonuclease/helicase Cas3